MIMNLMNEKEIKKYYDIIINKIPTNPNLYIEGKFKNSEGKSWLYIFAHKKETLDLFLDEKSPKYHHPDYLYLLVIIHPNYLLTRIEEIPSKLLQFVINQLVIEAAYEEKNEKLKYLYLDIIEKFAPYVNMNEVLYTIVNVDTECFYYLFHLAEDKKKLVMDYITYVGTTKASFSDMKWHFENMTNIPFAYKSEEEYYTTLQTILKDGTN